MTHQDERRRKGQRANDEQEDEENEQRRPAAAVDVTSDDTQFGRGQRVERVKGVGWVGVTKGLGVGNGVGRRGWSEKQEKKQIIFFPLRRRGI